MENPENLEVNLEVKLPQDYDIGFQYWMLANNYAIKTIQNYHKNIINLTCGKDHLTVPIVKEFLGTNKDSLSKRGAVKLFFLFLEDKHNIVFPTFRYPRIAKSTKALGVISKVSFDQLCSSFDPFVRMFAIVMYYGGLRVTETAKIRTQDFNWAVWMKNPQDYGELKITQSKRNKDRIIPFSPSLMQEIFDFADKTEDGYLKLGHLFNYRWGKRSNGSLKDYDFYMKRKLKKDGLTEAKAERMYINKLTKLFWAKLSETSKKEIGKHIKTHILRASRATHLDEKGMPPTSIQYLLGHENLATTSRYIINTPEKLKKNLKEIE